MSKMKVQRNFCELDIFIRLLKIALRIQNYQKMLKL